MRRIRMVDVTKLLFVIIVLVFLFLNVTMQRLFPQQRYKLDTIKLGMEFNYDIELVIAHFHSKTDLNTFPILINVGDYDYNIDWIKPDILQVQCSNGKSEKIKLNNAERKHHSIIMLYYGYLGYVLESQ